MKRLIMVLMLGAFVGAVAGCCDCDKKLNETWGPGLMHWSDTTKPATMPAAK